MQEGEGDIMARLIDADKFLSSMIKRFKCVPLIGRNDYDCESLKQMLIEAPTVDAVPVVHGRWVPSMEEMEDGFGETHMIQTGVECSVCGHYSCCGGNFCKDCGARMNLKEESDA